MKTHMSSLDKTHRGRLVLSEPWQRREGQEMAVRRGQTEQTCVDILNVSSVECDIV